VIGEIVGPLTVAPLGGSPTATLTGTLAQASLRGTPGAPDDFTDRGRQAEPRTAPSGGPVAAAEHLEFHGRLRRIDAGPSRLDLALDLKKRNGAALVSVLGTSGRWLPLQLISLSSLCCVGLLTCTEALGQRLREIQAANGPPGDHQARCMQGDLIATATARSPHGARHTHWRLAADVVNFASSFHCLALTRSRPSRAAGSLSTASPRP